MKYDSTPNSYTNVMINSILGIHNIEIYDCNNWWFDPTVDRNGNIIARSSLDQTYEYSVYIGRYTKNGNLISNY